MEINTIGDLARWKAPHELTNEQAIGIDVVLNFDAPAGTALSRSREILRSLFPSSPLMAFNRAYSRVANPDKLIQLDEKAKHDLAEFRRKQQEDRKRRT